MHYIIIVYKKVNVHTIVIFKNFKSKTTIFMFTTAWSDGGIEGRIIKLHASRVAVVQC